MGHSFQLQNSVDFCETRCWTLNLFVWIYTCMLSLILKSITVTQKMSQRIVACIKSGLCLCLMAFGFIGLCLTSANARQPEVGLIVNTLIIQSSKTKSEITDFCSRIMLRLEPASSQKSLSQNDATKADSTLDADDNRPYLILTVVMETINVDFSATNMRRKNLIRKRFMTLK